jgi:hypothetical protein
VWARLLKNPITGIAGCCARAASGHDATAPPSSVMNSRRFTSNFSRASKRKIALRETYCTAGFQCALCPLWVKSGGDDRTMWPPMSASLRKRTIGGRPVKSALCHKATYALQQTAPYSITSSARPSREIGTVIPNALAVLRLITNSTLVVCCTGRSAGFSPFRTRPA